MAESAKRFNRHQMVQWFYTVVIAVLLLYLGTYLACTLCGRYFPHRVYGIGKKPGETTVEYELGSDEWIPYGFDDFGNPEFEGVLVVYVPLVKLAQKYWHKTTDGTAAMH